MRTSFQIYLFEHLLFIWMKIGHSGGQAVVFAEFLFQQFLYLVSSETF